MFNVTRGRQTAAIKGLLYGVPGIGKTTFAAKWPGALFLDVEGSSEQLDNDDISRIDPAPATYREFLSMIDQIAVDTMGFKTLVIDTADWLESMMIRQICQDAGISSIEKYEKGFGKGWTKVCETWAELLDKLDRIRKQKGMNILFVAHARIRKFEPADDVAYDRYTLSQNEKSGDILKKWADIILFTKHSVLVTENEDGRIKAHSNGKRMMYTTFNPCWDAKNRFGLPEELPFDFSRIAHIFRTVENTTPVMQQEASQNAQEPPPPVTPPELPPPPTETPETPSVSAEQLNLISQIENLLKIDKIGYGELTKVVENKGIVPAGTPLQSYNIQTLQRIIKGWAAIKNNVNIMRKDSSNDRIK